MTLEASSRFERPIGGSDPGEIGYSDASFVARLRLPYHLVEPTVIALDIIIVVSTCVIAVFGYNCQMPRVWRKRKLANHMPRNLPTGDGVRLLVGRIDAFGNV